MIKIRQGLVAICVFACSLPAFADLSISNTTSAHATARTTTSPCSSAAGDQGILKPNSTLVVPKFVVDLFCLAGCDAQVFISKDCSAKKIATAHIESLKGVTSITNHNVEGYYVTASGNSVTIAGGPSQTWFDYLFRKA